MLTFLHPHFSYRKQEIPDAHIVEFSQFSDGWPRIFLHDKSLLENQDVTYIGDFRFVESVFGQIAFLDGLMRYHIGDLHIVIPFFPAASMERDTPSGELSIAHVFARLFGLIGEKKPGHIHIHLFDIHDERELFYFPPTLQIHHHTTTHLLRERIETLDTKPVILFPDAGAKKAFSRFFGEYEIVTCTKVRKSPTEIEMFFEGGKVEGKDVFIIDDHIRTGGTLIEASKSAREQGARSVSAFAPHSVFASGIHGDFLRSFDTFYTTDSIPTNRESLMNSPNTQVMSFPIDTL